MQEGMVDCGPLSLRGSCMLAFWVTPSPLAGTMWFHVFLSQTVIRLQLVLVIGYLSSRSPDETAHLVAAFRRGLGENGFVEGQNVTIEYRWALGQYDRLPAMRWSLFVTR